MTVNLGVVGSDARGECGVVFPVVVVWGCRGFVAVCDILQRISLSCVAGAVEYGKLSACLDREKGN